MVGSAQASVGSGAAVLLASAPPGPVNEQVGAVLLLADATLDVFVGGSNVSTTNGLKLTHAITTPILVPLFPGDQLYGIAASGTATVGVLQV